MESNLLIRGQASADGLLWDSPSAVHLRCLFFSPLSFFSGTAETPCYGFPLFLTDAGHSQRNPSPSPPQSCCTVLFSSQIWGRNCQTLFETFWQVGTPFLTPSPHRRPNLGGLTPSLLPIFVGDVAHHATCDLVTAIWGGRLRVSKRHEG